MTSRTPLFADRHLRAVTQQLAITPSKELPHVVPFLANSLANCKDVLSVSEQGKSNAETRVLVHKLKTQLSTLLHEKIVEARWSAAILIKAAIEAGGWAILQSCGSWTQRLLTILGKPEPPAAKKVYIVTLTRIFLLTQGHQSLLREITTPSIPTFITASLNSISLPRSAQDSRRLDHTSPLLDTVLQALIRLIVHHPASFRPFVNQIKSLIVHILIPISPRAPTRESIPFPSCASSHANVLAQQLYTLLPYCAPKNTSNEEWTKSIREVLTHIHRNASFVFRAIIEDWTPPAGLPIAAITAPRPGNDLADNDFDAPLCLPGWAGIEAGCERLTGLLQILESHIATQGPCTYCLPVGLIWSALDRLLSVTVPLDAGGRDSTHQPRINPEIAREEREGLWFRLPGIHIAAIAVMSTLSVRLQTTAMSLAPSMIELILWVFDHEKDDPNIRMSAYRIFAQVLDLIGPSVSRDTVSSMSPLINTLCNDLLPMSSQTEKVSDTLSVPGKGSNANGMSANADAFLQRKDSRFETKLVHSELQSAADALLPVMFSKIPSLYLPAATRATMDRTAILLRHEKAMLASVLNPQERPKGKQGSSILPFLARNSGMSLEVEGLLRPRMPGLQQTWGASNAVYAPEDERVEKQTEIERPDVPMNSVFPIDDLQVLPENVTQLPAMEDQNTPIVTNPYGDHPSVEDSNNASVPSTATPYGISTGEVLLSEPVPKPSKRSRENGQLELSTEESDMELGMPSDKRARVLNDTTPTLAAEMQPINPARVSGKGFTPALATTSKDTKSISNREAGGNSDSDSDGSFEIPPIHLPSDLEDEDEDENVEEDQEEK